MTSAVRALAFALLLLTESISLAHGTGSISLKNIYRRTLREVQRREATSEITDPMRWVFYPPGKTIKTYNPSLLRHKDAAGGPLYCTEDHQFWVVLSGGAARSCYALATFRLAETPERFRSPGEPHQPAPNDRPNQVFSLRSAVDDVLVATFPRHSTTSSQIFHEQPLSRWGETPIVTPVRRFERVVILPTGPKEENTAGPRTGLYQPTFFDASGKPLNLGEDVDLSARYGITRPLSEYMAISLLESSQNVAQPDILLLEEVVLPGRRAVEAQYPVLPSQLCGE